jgi:hypothetical protein
MKAKVIVPIAAVLCLFVGGAMIHRHSSRAVDAKFQKKFEGTKQTIVNAIPDAPSDQKARAFEAAQAAVRRELIHPEFAEFDSADKMHLMTRGGKLLVFGEVQTPNDNWSARNENCIGERSSIQRLTP